MSKDNVKHMFAKIDKDESMKKSYEQLMKSCHEEYEKIIAQRLIEFGKTKGFAFSKDDLISAQADLDELGERGLGVFHDREPFSTSVFSKA